MSKHHKTALFFISILLLLFFFTAAGFWYYAAVVLVWISVVFVGSAFIDSNYHVKAYCNNPAETRQRIAITFDDGPNPLTPKFLEILQRHHAKAAFFCIGKNIETHPEILQQTVLEGHIVGNHSYSHAPGFDFFGKEKVLDELQQTDRLIEKYIGKKPNFFRPPYGVTNPAIRQALEITGHKAIGWSIRSFDARLKEEDLVFNRVKKRISPGGIILLHDTSEHSANVLERLLVTLREKNYEVVSLEELLNIKAYEN